MILLAMKNGTKRVSLSVSKTFTQLFPKIKYTRYLKYSEKENLYTDCHEFMYSVVWLILLTPRRKGRGPCTDAPPLRKTRGDRRRFFSSRYSIVDSSMPKD